MSKKLMAIVLALVMCLTMLPVTAVAAEPITYVKRSWNESEKTVDVSDDETITEYALVKSDDTAWSAGFYVVQGDVTITEDVTLSGDVNLILCDGAKLTVNGMITDEENGYGLTVYGQTNDSGELNVTNDESTVVKAIYVDSLTVSGGTVAATGVGSNSGDGIFANAMEVNGGSVIAEGIGDKSGRGIFVGGGCELKINGGIVVAKGTAYTVEDGAGGKGIFSGGSINITGGIVAAMGVGEEGADGRGICVSPDESGSINITGGCVVAKGSSAAMKLVGGGVLTLAQFAEIPTGTTLYLETDETNKYPYQGSKNSFDGSVTKFKESITDASTPAKSAVVEYYTAAPESVSYVERSLDGTKVKEPEKTVTIGIDATALNSSSGATWNAGTYVVVRDTLIAGDVQIDGNVKLVLCDGAKLTVLGMIRDYEVDPEEGWDGSRNDGCSLTICGQKNGSGELYVSGGEYGGIDVAKLTIGGGSVVTADSLGAGDAGSITVLGGSVTAKSNNEAIYTNNMDVYGGTVIAEGIGGDHAAGIHINEGILNIYGGSVTAKGAYYSEGYPPAGAWNAGISMNPSEDLTIRLNVYGGSLVAAGSGSAICVPEGITAVNGVEMASNTDIPEGVTIKTASNMDGSNAADWDAAYDLNSEAYKYVSIVFEENDDDDDSSAVLRLVRAALVTVMTVSGLFRGVTSSAARIARIAAFNATLPVIIARWFWHF